MKPKAFKKTLELTFLALLATPVIFAAKEEAEWTTLFDGESLENFVQRNGMATYHIEDGAIVGRTAEGSPNSFLCTREEYGDFELEFEVKVDDRLNSGVQIRSNANPSEDGDGNRRRGREGRVNGPQVEIEAGGEEGAEAGYLYGEAAGGWMTPEDKRTPHKHFKDGEWNHYRVVAQGPRIQVWINGEPISDLVDEEKYQTHPKGFIGLQVHGIPRGAGPYEVAWRNLRIREL